MRLQQQVEALESEVQEAHKVAKAHDSLSLMPTSSPVLARSSAAATTETTTVDTTPRCPSPDSQSTLAASSRSLLSVREKLRKKRENESRLLQRFHSHDVHGQALQPPEPKPPTAAQPQEQAQPQRQRHQPPPPKKLQPVATTTGRGQPSKDPALEWRFRLLGMQLNRNVTSTAISTGHYDTESCTMSTSSSGGSLSEPPGVGQESKCSDTERSSPHRRPSLSLSPSRNHLRVGGRHQRGPTGHSVSFQSVQVRTYQQTLGDNPSVTFGLPICLDWSFQVEAPIPIDVYETSLSHRGDQGSPSVHSSSSSDHLFLSSVIRHRILTNRGFTDLELDRVSQQLTMERQERLERVASLQDDSMLCAPQYSVWCDNLQTATRFTRTKHQTTDVFHGDGITNTSYLSSRDCYPPHSTMEPMIASQFVTIVR
jgi:hypothetical protein